MAFSNCELSAEETNLLIKERPEVRVSTGELSLPKVVAATRIGQYNRQIASHFFTAAGGHACMVVVLGNEGAEVARVA